MTRAGWSFASTPMKASAWRSRPDMPWMSPTQYVLTAGPSLSSQLENGRGLRGGSGMFGGAGAREPPRCTLDGRRSVQPVRALRDPARDHPPYRANKGQLAQAVVLRFDRV